MKKTPRLWQEEHGVTVYDPDGWRTPCGNLLSKCFSEPITEEEFIQRAAYSTCLPFVPVPKIEKER